MTVARKKILGLALAMVAGASLIAWGVLRRGQVAGSIIGCIKGNGCQGIVVKAGSQALSPVQLDEIFADRSVREGAKLVKNGFVQRHNERSLLFLTANVGRGEQAFTVDLFESERGHGFLLGPILLRLLTIKNLARDSNVATMGPLYTHIASDMRELAPRLQRLGIERVEVVSTETVPVMEAEAALRRFADLNRDTPLRVIRP